jgi:hypothetical protein
VRFALFCFLKFNLMNLIFLVMICDAGAIQKLWSRQRNPKPVRISLWFIQLPNKFIYNWVTFLKFKYFIIFIFEIWEIFRSGLARDSWSHIYNLSVKFKLRLFLIGWTICRCFWVMNLELRYFRANDPKFLTKPQ